MFTGIIRELGTVTRIERSKDLVRLTVFAPRTAARVGPLESIAVNGVCVSVVQVSRGAMTFELIPETRRLTTLGTLTPGVRVHMEPSLAMSDRLNGHILLGHVDGVGSVVTRRQFQGELVLEIRAPTALRRFLVPKGPIAVDGVSLTLGQAVRRSTFTIHLIPETLRQTTLGSRRRGQPVNLEVDYLAKLILQFAVPR